MHETRFCRKIKASEHGDSPAEKISPMPVMTLEFTSPVDDSRHSMHSTDISSSTVVVSSYKSIPLYVQGCSGLPLHRSGRYLLSSARHGTRTRRESWPFCCVTISVMAIFIFSVLNISALKAAVFSEDGMKAKCMVTVTRESLTTLMVGNDLYRGRRIAAYCRHGERLTPVIEQADAIELEIKKSLDPELSQVDAELEIIQRLNERADNAALLAQELKEMASCRVGMLIGKKCTATRA